MLILYNQSLPVLTPNYIEKWHESCKNTHDKNIYVQGHSTDALEQQYQNCVAQISYPSIPFTSKDCKTYYDQEYGKLQRALEVGQISQDNEDANTAYLEKDLQKCYDNAVTLKQQKCYVQLSNLIYHEDNVATELNDGVVYDSIQGYYDNALTKYNHCMGVKPDSLSKEPVYKSSKQIIKDEAHRQCEEQWESQQGYMPCIEEHSSDIEPYITDKCDEMKPYDLEEWYLTGTTFDQWNQCQIDAGTALYQLEPVRGSEPEPEPLEEVEIVCGKGTVLIDHICQVDKIEEKEKEIPVEKTIEKTVDVPVEKVVDTPVEEPVKKVKKSGGWFDWLFDLFNFKTEPEISSYDCVETWDELYELDENHSGDNRYGYEFVDLKVELFENSCYTTLESWAYKAKYQDKIWGQNWQALIVQNQHWNNEIDCQDEKCEKLKQEVKRMKDDYMGK